MLPAPLRSPRTPLLAVALIAPLALSACTSQSSNGSATFKGQKKKVSDQITKLSDLADDRKASQICSDLFTPTLKAEFAKVGGGDCAEPVLRAIKSSDYTRFIVDAIDLGGPESSALTAVARVKVTSDGPKRTISFARADTGAPWLISAFDASANAQSAKGTTPSTTPSASPSASPSATATPKP